MIAVLFSMIQRQEFICLISTLFLSHYLLQDFSIPVCFTVPMIASRPFLNYKDTTISSKYRGLFKKYGEPEGPTMYQMDSTYSKTLDTLYTFRIIERKDFHGWNGFSLYVQPIEEERSIEKHNRKVYKITVFIYEGGMNPTDYVYYIELENLNCTNKRNLTDFVKNAHVTLFYFYMRAQEI